MADYKWGENPYKTYPPRGVNGTDIVENPDTNPMLIGHTLAWCNDLENAYNEALSKLDEYYNWLVRIGEIVPPKTAEEIAQEAAEEQIKIAKEVANEQIQVMREQNEKQAALIDMQMEAMKAMLQEIKGIGGVNSGDSRPSVSEVATVRTKGNGSTKQRPENETGSGAISE